MIISGNMADVKVCDVTGCSKEAERSINTKKIRETSITVKNESAKSSHLCKDHYRTFKKETKKDRKLDHLGY